MDSGPRKKEEKPLVQDHDRQPSCECNHAFGRARQDAPKDGDPDGAQVQQIRSSNGGDDQRWRNTFPPPFTRLTFLVKTIGFGTDGGRGMAAGPCGEWR
ncbi:hypothetical protein CCM_04846 [Cordyceps militaris CM01]|uniref:Uncharacterized protein n=1 Tax=Cordyceps militaris (strain CM01) TaxID=983644 RepID=G3JEX9_CORMM|nr:uncharacterized protein CCM_04846 [Cordyceps militaris CM01]EGX93472.1 hypothetical protein CCM_04846 [Cordyceps militaris CM01]